MTGNVVHLVQLAECGLHEVPARSDWLTPRERDVLAGLHVEKRRNDWLLGRWCAHRALSALVGAGGRGMSVLAAPDGAPEVVDGAHLRIAITHREGQGAAVAAHAPLRIGCDLEWVEPRSDAFIRDYFTAREAAHVLGVEGAARGVLANLCWSAKESVLKALRVGLTTDTRSVDVALPEAAELRQDVWLPLHAESASAGGFTGCWRWRDHMLLTVLGDAGLTVRETYSVS